MLRTFKLYFLSNFQIYQTEVLSIVIMLYIISPVLIYLITGSLNILTTFIPLPWVKNLAVGKWHVVSCFSLETPPPLRYSCIFLVVKERVGRRGKWSLIATFNRAMVPSICGCWQKVILACGRLSPVPWTLYPPHFSDFPLTLPGTPSAYTLPQFQ